MKKVLIVLILILVFLLGTTVESMVEDGQKWMETLDKSINYKVLRHRATGVCYLNYAQGITPMYNPDGSLYVLGE